MPVQTYLGPYEECSPEVDCGARAKNHGQASVLFSRYHTGPYLEEGT
ncbi:MAG TPA: hypothetical protein VN442_26100 [Bryobacteraceae bacterium]|nr:hypothetical protein [Bryobacteraceae bacterium]